MKTRQRQTLTGIMNSMDGVILKERHGGKFHFRLHLTNQMMNAPLEALELGQRSYNCLKRAGFSTIGEVLNAISGGTDLKTIRNCGSKSIREIMEQLFLYQYTSLCPEKQEEYLKEVVQMNVERDMVRT